MELHNHQDALPQGARGAVVAIGNFDGVHLGHRALVEKAREIAARESAPAGVLTFEPHPREFFQPEGEPFRLTLAPMKQRLLAGLGVEHLFSLAFDEKLSSLSADEFIQKILAEALGVKHVVTGRDFAFGKGRAGNVESLRKSGLFGVTTLDDAACGDGQPYSSTRIRALLKEAEFGEASRLLGWDWQIEMPVVHGDKRGRELGFPTANQQPGRHLQPPYGIYAVQALIEGESAWRGGVANFGIRPMFRVRQPIFETYIFDFSGDIYGKIMRVRPLRLLREEQSFEGLEALKAQMKQDCHDAAAVLKSSQL
jgi:riboflavin kinase/FMN adenylyltransferase